MINYVYQLRWKLEMIVTIVDQFVILPNEHQTDKDITRIPG
jgi:hypothetical protein